MGNITMVAANVRPLEGAIVVKALAGEELTVGQVVYVSATSGAKATVSKADASAVATSHCALGIVVAGPVTSFGSTTVASGATCDVCVYGPCEGFSSLSAGVIWVSDDAGLMGTTVGTKSVVVGFGLTATSAFINPLPVAVSA